MSGGHTRFVSKPGDKSYISDTLHVEKETTLKGGVVGDLVPATVGGGSLGTAERPWESFHTEQVVADEIVQSTATIEAAGDDQATATPVTTAVASVTEADGTAGVILPARTLGQRVTVHNRHATSNLKVYPDVGGTINLGAREAAVNLAGATVGIYHCIDQATAILLNDPDLINSSTWDFVGITAADTIADPLGGTGAFRLTENTANSLHNANNKNRSKLFAGETYRASVYAKSAERHINWHIRSLGTNPLIFVALRVDLTTGAILRTDQTAGAVSNVVITSLASDWWYISYDFIPTADFTTSQAIIYIAKDATPTGGLSYVGEEKSIDVFRPRLRGMQLGWVV